MGKSQILNKIRYELDKLNEQIDLAIIEGRNYKSLASKHKILLSRFNRLQSEGSSLLTKSFRFLTLF
ncbi:MAG TPA: hypothetical protein VFA52_01615 [Candidatus Paceibacterota bacterium]|nr:hypothetical protein [Candidatus Paceibacterota bacterium]